MQFRFVNRQEELEFLNSSYENKGFQFIIIHGRRRVGKTVLLRQFLTERRGVYLVADQVSKKIQYERMYQTTTEQLEGRSLTFPNIDDYLEYIHAKSVDERLVLIIDEYQYLMEIDPPINSILQRWIDLSFKDGQLMLILAGSEIRMMHELFAYQNPLHGRRTGQMKIKQFNIVEVGEYFPNLKVDDLLKILGVFGGVPFYLQFYESDNDLWWNIENIILNPRDVMFEEPPHLLRQEFREIKRYFAILLAISSGNHRLVDISDTTGIQARSLTKYMNSLQETELIRRDTPVGIDKQNNRYVRYNLLDNFLKFWFHFVFPNKDQLELMNTESILSVIKNRFDDYMGPIFERACIQLLKLANMYNLLPFSYKEFGNWWKKGIEIDIIGLPADKKDPIMVIECKWGNRINGGPIISKLDNKIESSLWREYNRGLKIVLARGFSKKIQNCLTFEDLYKSVITKNSLNIEL